MQAGIKPLISVTTLAKSPAGCPAPEAKKGNPLTKKRQSTLGTVCCKAKGKAEVLGVVAASSAASASSVSSASSFLAASSFYAARIRKTGAPHGPQSLSLVFVFSGFSSWTTSLMALPTTRVGWPLVRFTRLQYIN